MYVKYTPFTLTLSALHFNHSAAGFKTNVLYQPMGDFSKVSYYSYSYSPLAIISTHLQRINKQEKIQCEHHRQYKPLRNGCTR